MIHSHTDERALGSGRRHGEIGREIPLRDCSSGLRRSPQWEPKDRRARLYVRGTTRALLAWRKGWVREGTPIPGGPGGHPVTGAWPVRGEAPCDRGSVCRRGGIPSSVEKDGWWWWPKWNMFSRNWVRIPKRTLGIPLSRKGGAKYTQTQNQ